MKTKIDIITGFLDSGKTTLINGMLENKELTGEKVVILQLEAGEIEIDTEPYGNENIFIKKREEGQTADPSYIREVLDEYRPDRIIIECNGMKGPGGIFSALGDRSVRKRCFIDRVVCTIDASMFEIYMDNMGDILVDQISDSDLIVLDKTYGFAQDRLDKIEKTLKALNRSAEIVRAVIYDGLNTDADKADRNISGIRPPGAGIKASDILFGVFAALIAAYIIFSILRVADLSSVHIDLTWFQVLNTVFLSILMQAFPFILVGVFVSSIIQVFISDEAIVKFFPRRTGVGFVVAMLAGVLFPVCDCAIVPVAARLVKKGVPLQTAVVFMLSAPIVNPIVIASTLYAFPGQPYIAFYRVFIGLTVAFAVGLILTFFPEDNSVLINNMGKLTCKCGCCDDKLLKSRGIAEKACSVLRHAGSEFFEVGRFLIIGAFLSSIMQTLIPKDIFSNLLGKNVLSLLVMMAAAFVFSVCSTSDAFIGRTFLSQFSTGSVMGFLVLGPMIDIKNMLMLLSSFRKTFVIKLVAIIFGSAFVLLYLFTLLLF